MHATENHELSMRNCKRENTIQQKAKGAVFVPSIYFM